jgi:hypothetical protein
MDQSRGCSLRNRAGQLRPRLHHLGGPNNCHRKWLINFSSEFRCSPAISSDVSDRLTRDAKNWRISRLFLNTHSVSRIRGHRSKKQDLRSHRASSRWLTKRPCYPAKLWWTNHALGASSLGSSFDDRKSGEFGYLGCTATEGLHIENAFLGPRLERPYPVSASVIYDHSWWMYSEIRRSPKLYRVLYFNMTRRPLPSLDDQIVNCVEEIALYEEPSQVDMMTDKDFLKERSRDFHLSNRWKKVARARSDSTYE